MEHIAIRQLSILIPVHDYVCTPLVKSLLTQAAAIDTLSFEIIVADDGSNDEQTIAQNSFVTTLPHCVFIRHQPNIGRAAIRNLLARRSRYPWLLFLDCDVSLTDDQFLQRYLMETTADVIDGGITVVDDKSLWRRHLRYTYEKDAESRNKAENRQKQPYKSFRTTNFIVRRDVMTAVPFDERFRHYGYEDVLFGKQLRARHFTITHTDNPVVIDDLEPNDVFVAKTEESLRTLHTFRKELSGYSTLLTLVNGIHLPVVRHAIRLWHRLLGPTERRWLCSPRPSLTIFKLYKIGYYLSLKN